MPDRHPAIAPERRNGWLILHVPEFEARFLAIAQQVEALRARDPVGYHEHPTTKLLAAVIRLVRDVVPSDPNAPRFRLENDLRKFRRAKKLGLPPRYRLFWVFSEHLRTIVFLYLNDEGTLRKDGASSDPYEVFRRKIARGEIGPDFDANFRAWRAAYPKAEFPAAPGGQ